MVFHFKNNSTNKSIYFDELIRIIL